MGDLVDIRFQKVLDNLKAWKPPLSLPTLEVLGWEAIEAVDGMPFRYCNPRYDAYLGYTQGSPETTYFEYHGVVRGFEGLTLEELALGLDTGILENPDFVIEP